MRVAGFAAASNALLAACANVADTIQSLFTATTMPAGSFTGYEAFPQQFVLPRKVVVWLPRLRSNASASRRALHA